MGSGASTPQPQDQRIQTPISTTTFVGQQSQPRLTVQPLEHITDSSVIYRLQNV